MGQKLIVVLGATGNQGGSVVDTFVREGAAWRVRGITRNKSSTKAQALISQGVQMVEADMAKPSTLSAAFEGANVIFAVSDFMGIYRGVTDGIKPGQERNAWAAEQEEQQLKNVIDEAAKIQSLERLVFSSLSNATKWSRGKFTHVYHFDGKAKAEEYGRQEYPDLWSKTSVFQGGMFLELLRSRELQPIRVSIAIRLVMLYRWVIQEPDGKIVFNCPFNPKMLISWLSAVEDSGPLVRALVLDEPGKNLLAYRQRTTLPDVVATFSQITGLQAETKVIPVERWLAGSSPDLVLEFADFFGYWDEFGFEAQTDPPIVHPSQLNVDAHLGSIEDWIAKQDWSAIIDGGEEKGAPLQH